MKIMDATGPKANIVRVPLKEDGDKLHFTVSKRDLVERAKDSKTGKSEGLMVSLTGTFNYDLPVTMDDGSVVTQKVAVTISQGQGGMGSWTSLKAAKVL